MRFILILSLLLGLVGCASTPEKMNPTIANLEKVGNYQGIVNLYRQQLASKPTNSKIMLKLADAYCHLGDIESAMFYISQLKKPHQHTGEYYFVAANIDMAAENYQSAITHYKQAITHHYKKPDIHINQGIAYGYLKNYTQASAAFNRARLHGYDECIIKNNLATLKIAQNKNQEAADLLLPIYLHNTKNKTVAFNLAIALVRTGHELQAKEILAAHYSKEEAIQLIHALNAPVS